MKPVKGHGLLYEGKTYMQWTYRSPSPLGPGRCSCGAISPNLPTTAARQRWHKEHKQAVLDGGTEVPK